MLKRIGIASIDELFADVPEDLRLKRPLDLPPSMAESEVLQAISNLAGKNHQKTLFAGVGQYDHIIPSVVQHLTGRSEFLTSYTPYQAEISQGILQALFEFQSAMAEITGLPVSNASLYDGFTAAAEACAMACGPRRKSQVIWVGETVHPHTRSVLRGFFAGSGIECRILEENNGRVDSSTLQTALATSEGQTAAVLIQTPNLYGILEDLSGWSTAVKAAGARFIIAAHPLSLGALASPAEWGADIAVGDTQPLGLPPYFGGPSAGFITCRRDLMRRMPGRIVGETHDIDGKRAFTLTLQAREQHIKRERATSNICTNQSLAALANLIYLTALGPEGFVRVSELNIRAAATLRRRLNEEVGIPNHVEGSIFNEFTLRIPCARERWDRVFARANIMPGVWLSDLDSNHPSNLLTVAVTEKRRVDEMDQYLRCAREALK